MRRSVAATVLALAALPLSPEVPAAASERAIVIVGGPKSEGPLRHDYPNGVRILKALIEAAPQLGTLPVVAYPDGWPGEPDAFERAAVIVWYFDGAERHPLLDAGRRARFEAAMGRGVGLVALHQSSTVPAQDDPGLAQWLGAARHGMVDRVDEIARLVPANHPVTRGIGQPFEHFDEFYPTLRFAPAAVPVLSSQRYVAAWAFERAGGGRSLGFTGAHYLLTLDRAPIRTLLLNAIAWAAGREVPEEGVVSTLPAAARPIAERLDTGTFHHDAQRSGWNPMETALTPARVAAGGLGLLWRSEPFADHQGQAPRLYASPLYFDRIRMARRDESRIFSVVYAATNHGDVYAVNAFAAGDVPAGAILWHRKLGEPCKLQPAPLDGVPTGILSTPAVHAPRNVLYVTHCDPVNRWQAYALDLGTGKIADGWPVRLDEATLNAANRNAGETVLPPRRRFDFRVQRAALNLSPDGRFLYVAFGETETGWLVAIDTASARVSSAFATQAIPHRGSGGIWGAGGPAVDAAGRIYVVTGTGYDGYADHARDWTQSVLALDHGPEGFILRGTYTPFNFCDTARADIDLGSGGASLLPGSDWMVVGGKQGNVYLLDRTRLPGRLDRRPPCSTDAAGDASLLPPGAQPQFGTRGPLNVFGPYSERDAAMDLARARSVPAGFRDERGRQLVFVTGNTKRAEGSPDSIPPSLARLEVVEGRTPHLRIDQVENTLVFENPGSPLVSSNASRDAIVWVLDENARRSASLAGADAPRPVLHALDALTLKPLWRSRPGELATSGKYNQPVVARGRVFVGTDRIQAFGIGPRLVEAEPARQALASPPAALAASPVATRDGKTVYAERCAACHDHPQGSIPPRAVIAARPHARIVEVLTTGSMGPYAAGLGAAEIEAVARYLQ